MYVCLCVYAFEWHDDNSREDPLSLSHVYVVVVVIVC